MYVYTYIGLYDFLTVHQVCRVGRDIISNCLVLDDYSFVPGDKAIGVFARYYENFTRYSVVEISN